MDDPHWRTGVGTVLIAVAHRHLAQGRLPRRDTADRCRLSPRYRLLSDNEVAPRRRDSRLGTADPLPASKDATGPVRTRPRFGVQRVAPVASCCSGAYELQVT